MKTCMARSSLLLLVASVSAEFLTPDKAIGTGWRKGAVITIRWNSSWPEWNDGPSSTTNYDLWITMFKNSDYEKKLHEFGDVRGGGEWNWTVDAPERLVDSVTGVIFRFQEHRDSEEYDTGSWQYPSWPFAIVPALEASSSDIESSAPTVFSLFSTLTASSLFSASAIASVPDGTATMAQPEPSNTSERPVPESSSNEKKQSSSGSNSGVIAGAVVGGLAGSAAIVGGILLLLRRKKRRDRKTPVFEIDGDVTQTPGTTATDLAIAAQRTNAKYKRSDLPELVTAK